MEIGIKEAVEFILNWLEKRLTFRYFSLLLLICVAVAFGVDPVLVRMGLPMLSPIYRVMAVLFGAISLAGVAHASWEYVWVRMRRRWHLCRLSATEKKTLSSFVSADNPVQYFNPNDFVSTTLLDLGILKLAEDRTAYAFAAKSGCYYYGIDNATFQRLKKHPELLE